MLVGYLILLECYTNRADQHTPFFNTEAKTVAIAGIAGMIKVDGNEVSQDYIPINDFRWDSMPIDIVYKFVAVPDYVPTTFWNSTDPGLIKGFNDQLLKMLVYFARDQVSQSLLLDPQAMPKWGINKTIEEIDAWLENWFSIGIEFENRIHGYGGEEASQAIALARWSFYRTMEVPANSMWFGKQYPAILGINANRIASLYQVEMPTSHNVDDLIRSAANSGSYWDYGFGGVLADAYEDAGADGDHWYLRLLRDDVWPKIAHKSMFPFFATE